MSPPWAFEVILGSCVLLGTVYCGSFCGPSRMFACVPTRFCSETRSIPSNPAAYYNRQCFSFETCCDLNKVIFGKRYSGGQFLPGPYDQSVYTSEPVNNTGGKTSTTYNHPPNNTGGKTSTIIGEKSVTPNTGKTATSYNPEQTAPEKLLQFIITVLVAAVVQLIMEEKRFQLIIL
ncbi:uncharacterized protein LOC108039189 [Drosophila rhopaloa]|uniref:Uncharacterized protein n=1 Tax=Drosophila rhopaloa TaxID=1041015 RepID=A0ABM5GYC6_DRORH|nr:uncharacterized protein LOC108039189 [Drosophila rhopaloa]